MVKKVDKASGFTMMIPKEDIKVRHHVITSLAIMLGRHTIDAILNSDYVLERQRYQLCFIISEDMTAIC